MENKNLEETDVNEKQKARNGKSAMPMRTCLVMILAGVYVAYLGVSLCQNVINGAEGSSPGFMVAGVIFIVLGVAFVIKFFVLLTHLAEAAAELHTMNTSFVRSWRMVFVFPVLERFW